MVLEIQARDRKGHAHSLKINERPDACPICHHSIEVADLGWYHFANFTSGALIECIFRCPRKECQHLFIARYKPGALGSNMFELAACLPTEPRDHEWAQDLEKISPEFCDIYNEAYRAEQLGLLRVCGPGYRKSLEFLIKDYLKLCNPSPKDWDKIETSPLMSCIKDYVAEPRIKITAERAVWLGNDETHFVRKWEDKDLRDMKKFIDLTCYWIQSAQLTDEAVVQMPPRTK